MAQAVELGEDEVPEHVEGEARPAALDDVRQTQHRRRALVSEVGPGRDERELAAVPIEIDGQIVAKAKVMRSALRMCTRRNRSISGPK